MTGVNNAKITQILGWLDSYKEQEKTRFLSSLDSGIPEEKIRATRE